MPRERLWLRGDPLEAWRKNAAADGRRSRATGACGRASDHDSIGIIGSRELAREETSICRIRYGTDDVPARRSNLI
jgi:hypothetical protein